MPHLLSVLLAASLFQQSTPLTYVPERVYDTRRGAFSDFEVMLADIAAADVVFVGEQHDDPNTHRLETAILQGLLRRGRATTVSLEMFERDVQGTLDAFLAGRIDEAAFLAAARPWPRYATDYKPLVEVATANRWPVIGALRRDDEQPSDARVREAPGGRTPRDERTLLFRAVHQG